MGDCWSTLQPEAVNGSDKSEDDYHGNKEGSTRVGQVSGRGDRAPDSVVVDQTELEYWKAECREMNEKLCFLQKQLMRGRSGSFTSQVEGAEEGSGELERTRGLLSGVQSELAARESELESAREEVEQLRSKVKEGKETLACQEREWQSQRAGLLAELDLLRRASKNERRDQLSAGEVEPGARLTQLEREVQQQSSQVSALERERKRLKSQLEASAAAHQMRVEELEKALQKEREGGGEQKVAELLRRVDSLQQEKDKALADLAAIKKARKALASTSAVSSDGAASPAPPHSPSTGLAAPPDVEVSSLMPSLALPRKSEPSVGVAKVEFVPGGCVCMHGEGEIPQYSSHPPLPVFADNVGAFDEEASRLLRSRAQVTGDSPPACHSETHPSVGSVVAAAPLPLPFPAGPKAAPREYLEPWQVEHPNLRPIPLMAGEGPSNTPTHAYPHAYPPTQPRVSLLYCRHALTEVGPSIAGGTGQAVPQAIRTGARCS